MFSTRVHNTVESALDFRSATILPKTDISFLEFAKNSSPV